MHPVDYAAQTLRGVLDRIPVLDHAKIDDVLIGCSLPEKQLGWNTARLIVNRAGLPDTVPAQTINRFCSSGLQCIASAANAIIAGEMDVVVAGGVEDMTHCFAPFPEEYMNPWFHENYEGGYMPMGETAERVADKYGITREMMDEFSVESHARALKARTDGFLADSIIPVTNENGVLVTEDEGIRGDTSVQSLAGLKAVFREGGRVTAGNSSQTTDAAAVAVVMEAAVAESLGLKPIARFCCHAVTGCDPTIMGMGPVYAIPKVLEKCRLSLDDFDVIELNEAFASQAIACIETLDLPRDKVNPYGGAIALGHPMGATGVFLTIKALDYLKRTGGRYALVSMCIGGGMGAAGVFELL